MNHGMEYAEKLLQLMHTYEYVFPLSEIAQDLSQILEGK